MTETMSGCRGKSLAALRSAVTIYTQEETGVSVITLEDQAAQLKDCGTATTPQSRDCLVVSKYTLYPERVLSSEQYQLANNRTEYGSAQQRALTRLILSATLISI
jgi:hypothetical protein